MPLSAEDIRRAFVGLSEELERRQRRAEIVVVGGAAIVLLYGARESTKDVDAYFVEPEASVIRAAAEAVASRLELPGDWLNDAAKAYMVDVTTGDILFESPSLGIRAASNAQLLAMKLAAWRDAIDRTDARLLLERMTGTREEIWAGVKRFVPQHLVDKASYAFDDLWETCHGTD